MIRNCCDCGVILEAGINWSSWLVSKPYYKCKPCYRKQNKANRVKNKVKIKEQKRLFHFKHKEEINSKRRVENLTTAEIADKRADNKVYRDINNAQINARRRKRKKERFANDPSYRIREGFGNHFRKSLKLQKVDKRSSCFDILDYTFEELKQWLEKQFEDWMTWNNHGKYDASTWNDNDPPTWTWQIDHIEPKANFVFSNDNTDEIKRCWALTNLRPYSAKQNNIDGGSRVRHTKKEK